VVREKRLVEVKGIEVRGGARAPGGGKFGRASLQVLRSPTTKFIVLRLFREEKKRGSREETGGLYSGWRHGEGVRV
jgi:hypothetical protein